jgi:cell shape-determining protein MreC
MLVGKALFNLIILISVLAFGIFYGVDIAKNGIEQVNGPIGSAKDLTVEQMAAEQQNLVMEHKERMLIEAQKKLLAQQEQEQKEMLSLEQARVTSPSLMSRLFHKIGELLGWLAEAIVHGIVKMGRAVFG